MAFRLLGLLAVAVLMSCAGAQRKKRDWLFLMPVTASAEMTADELKTLPLMGRAAIVSAFDERNVLTISPVQMQVSERELNLKLDDPSLRNKEFYQKMAERWKARYVALVTITALESSEGPVEGLPPVPPPPGGQLNTKATAKGSLYDSSTKKFVFENREATVTLKVGRPGPSQRQVEGERLRAVSEVSKELFKAFLKKLPPKPPARGLGAGGG